jgi:hypothetical protein
MTTVEVSVQTLMVALQVLGAEMSRIEELLVSDPGEPDLTDLLLSYSKAEMEMKARYLDARELDRSLPPYEQLVPDA